MKIQLNVVFAILIVTFVSASSWALQPGEIVGSGAQRGTVRFFIGDTPVTVGENLWIRNSQGVRDVSIRVIAVTPPHATAEVIGVNLAASPVLEGMHSGRSVALSLDETEIYRAYFFAGPSFSEKVGEFGGSNYGLGLGFNGAFPFWTSAKLRWSFVLQADDLGEDSGGNGKRTSYYMAGLGQHHNGLQYFVHLGVVDNMTMPSGGKTRVDPYSGAQFPDNVTHSTSLGYLLVLKYDFAIRRLNRSQLWGWGVGPYVSVGGRFNGEGYKNTYTAGVSFNFERVF